MDPGAGPAAPVLAALPCLVAWNPPGTRKRSSDSSWSFSFCRLGLAPGHIPGTARRDPVSRQGADALALGDLSYSCWCLGSAFEATCGLSLSFPGALGGGSDVLGRVSDQACHLLPLFASFPFPAVGCSWHHLSSQCHPPLLPGVRASALPPPSPAGSGVRAVSRSASGGPATCALCLTLVPWATTLPPSSLLVPSEAQSTGLHGHQPHPILTLSAFPFAF